MKLEVCEVPRACFKREGFANVAAWSWQVRGRVAWLPGLVALGGTQGASTLSDWLILVLSTRDRNS
jgi:hypothetical protein